MEILKKIKELFMGKGKKEDLTPNSYDNITKENVPDTEEFKKRYEDFNRYSFKMSPVEYVRYKKFCDDHHDCRVYPDGRHRYGTIGGGTSVSFMGTGLGYIIECHCYTCGKTIDITDSTCW